jgi:hypothetical protein
MRTHVHSVFGLFAGTILMGNEPRGLNVLPLPAFRISGVEVRSYVDGASRAARCPSAAEAVLYWHVCVNAEVSLVGEWWLGRQVPCLLAWADSDLPEYTTLQWNFDIHGALRYTLSQQEARL